MATKDDLADKVEALIERRLNETTPDKTWAWSIGALTSAFESRMSELRETVELERKRRSDKSYRPSSVRRAGQILTLQQRTAIERAVEQFYSRMDARTEEVLKELQADEDGTQESENARALPPPEFVTPVVYLFAGPDRMKELIDELMEAVGPSGYSYAHAYMAWWINLNGPSVVLATILPAAVSLFEEHLSGLLRMGLLLYPNAMNLDERQMSYKEIREAGSAEAVLIHLIGKAVGDVLRQDAVGWNRQVSRWPGIRMEQLVSDWDSVIEATLRRNVIVHNGGRADVDYIRKLPPSIERPLPGQHLGIDADYLLTMLDRFTALGLGLSILWSKKLKPGLSQEYDRSVYLSVWLLERERWADLCAISPFLLDAIDDPESRDQITVNTWMAKREQYGVSAIAADVISWIPCNDDPRWEIARGALLSNFSDTRRAVQAALASGVTGVELENWPLIQPLVRQYPPIGQLLRKSPIQARPAKKRGKRK